MTSDSAEHATDDELRTPQEWCEHYQVTVLDPDGWRDPRDPKAWDEPVSLAEFSRRANRCTINPLNPGWDSVARDLAAARKKGAGEPKPAPPPIQVGVGMPAAILLDAFGEWLHQAYGATAYLVGSAFHGKNWRDVDVRLLMPDEKFHALFPGYRAHNQGDSRWALVCAAISALGKQQTGLPIDFQIQPVTEANERYPHPRNPLRLRRTAEE